MPSDLLYFEDTGWETVLERPTQEPWSWLEYDIILGPGSHITLPSGSEVTVTKSNEAELTGSLQSGSSAAIEVRGKLDGQGTTMRCEAATITADAILELPSDKDPFSPSAYRVGNERELRCFVTDLGQTATPGLFLVTFVQPGTDGAGDAAPSRYQIAILDPKTVVRDLRSPSTARAAILKRLDQRMGDTAARMKIVDSADTAYVSELGLIFE